MANCDYITFRYGKDNTLRLRKDSIVATVSRSDEGQLDVYVCSDPEPFSIPTTSADHQDILNTIWG